MRVQNLPLPVTNSQRSQAPKRAQASAQTSSSQSTTAATAAPSLSTSIHPLAASVADAVAQSPSGYQQIIYDQPQGPGGEAVGEYLSVMNYDKKQALAALVGIDYYV
ncbi:hypothetical protein VST7929_01147 [Vibrio stylophorae]|uniref:Uncharacterized protein n=1 Tax=Vibrio stylophorae TaxID=659351 RepID=A0ABN8DSH6_9VIBR|nr:hypothetical protein [Vibrio stylophorae]CAH0533283.1 hypothetical protein VST7929_01147 [Vibrio stylophorae]